MRSRPLFIIATYVTLLLAFAIYWSGNYTRFSHYKGDDIVITIAVPFGLSYLFFPVLAFNGIKFKVWLILMLPIAITGLSLTAGMLTLFITQLGGTEKQITLIYVVWYTAFAVLAAWIEMNNKRVKV
ncbi:hypothetical protein BC343_26330 [Mucilaginibacter pedocola]|uniref:Uncharacterized protein n=2 Tax=Mucilaginibacter pedocola TaxID=1792845 RepID=A0A1S9PH67_9SPHI|nr:hypothetical protein BC343_26330 [Mucilaginibacter pedocola]